MSALFSRMLHKVVETMQVFFVLEFDFDLILSVHAANLNLCIERLRKVFRGTAEEAGLRRLFSPGLFFCFSRPAIRRASDSASRTESFSLASFSVSFARPSSEGMAKNCAGVTGRDFLLVQHLLGVFGKVKQTQSVRDGRAAF